MNDILITQSYGINWCVKTELQDDWFEMSVLGSMLLVLVIIAFKTKILNLKISRDWSLLQKVKKQRAVASSSKIR